MTMQAIRILRRVGLAIGGLALVTALASCGGGNDDGGPPPVTPPVSNTPPASASASVAGFIAYVKVIVASSSDSGAPVDLTGFVAPTDDTGAFDPSI